MSSGTDNITPDRRVAVSDPRFDMRLTEKFNDEDASSTGWTWVIAILIAAILIVSGYWDQESGRLEGTTSSVGAEKYASNSTAPQTVSASMTDRQFTKGY